MITAENWKQKDHPWKNELKMLQANNQRSVQISTEHKDVGMAHIMQLLKFTQNAKDLKKVFWKILLTAVVLRNNTYRGTLSFFYSNFTSTK